MKTENSILKDVRESVGLTSEDTSFDIELLQHINASIGRVNQNGVGNFLVVEDETAVWGDLKNENQVNGNLYFHMIPLYISLMTKLLFDPPAPSSAQFHSSNAEELLWRLKIAYEDSIVQPLNDY